MKHIKSYNEEIDFKKLMGLQKKEEPKKEEINPVIENPTKYLEDAIKHSFQKYGTLNQNGTWEFPVSNVFTDEYQWQFNRSLDFLKNNPIQEITVKIHWKAIIAKLPVIHKNSRIFQIPYEISIKFNNLTNKSYEVSRKIKIENNYIKFSNKISVCLVGDLEGDSKRLWEKFELPGSIESSISSCEIRIEKEKAKDIFRSEFKEIIPDLKDLVGDIVDFSSDHSFNVDGNVLHCEFEILIHISEGEEDDSVNFTLTKSVCELLSLLTELQPRVKHVDPDVITKVEFSNNKLDVSFTKPTDIFFG